MRWLVPAGDREELMTRAMPPPPISGKTDYQLAAREKASRLGAWLVQNAKPTRPKKCKP